MTRYGERVIRLRDAPRRHTSGWALVLEFPDRAIAAGSASDGIEMAAKGSRTKVWSDPSAAFGQIRFEQVSVDAAVGPVAPVGPNRQEHLVRIWSAQ